jgi:hypothetical protein
MSQSIDPRRIEVIDDQMAQILRPKTPAERIAMIEDANQTARLLAAAGIQYQHPDWSEIQIQWEVARRMLGAAN